MTAKKNDLSLRLNDLNVSKAQLECIMWKKETFYDNAGVLEISRKTGARLRTRKMLQGPTSNPKYISIDWIGTSTKGNREINESVPTRFLTYEYV